MPKLTDDAEFAAALGGRMWSKLTHAEKFALCWSVWGCGEPEREYRFHATRRWRFDFAWPQVKVAVEVHGFGWGHQAQQHVSGDAEKARAAILCGWTVLTYTAKCLGSLELCREAVHEVESVILGSQ